MVRTAGRMVVMATLALGCEAGSLVALEADGGERAARDASSADAASHDAAADAGEVSTDAGEVSTDAGDVSTDAGLGEPDMCLAEAEACDALDQDCDGLVDEGLSEGCGSDVGECRAGTRACVDGSFGGACMGAIGPSDEACNSLDDDCDGSTDEALTQRCGSTDRGRCRYGARTCSGGSFGSCEGAIGPRDERCDDVDDDCDGRVDEGVSRACGTNVGICRRGTQTCSRGAYGSCTGGVNPRTEIDDGLDNDCDGSTDEGFPCENTRGQQVRAETNRRRRANGLSNLRCDKGLRRAAQAHADDMCRTGVFSHTSADGRTLTDRLREARATYTRAGENLLNGNTTPTGAVDAWMGSPPHRANILDSRFGRIGVGIANCPARSTTYWVQVFAN